MNNQARKVRPEIINVNSNEPVFYPFSIKTSKCSGSCNNINDPYAKICVPDFVKDLNVKVFNLMPSLHYNGTNSYLFVNGIEIFKFKAKDSEIVASALCLGKISKDRSVDNMKKKKKGFTGYIYGFSVDYDSIAVDDIKGIHKYLMKKYNIV